MTPSPMLSFGRRCGPGLAWGAAAVIRAVAWIFVCGEGRLAFRYIAWSGARELLCLGSVAGEDGATCLRGKAGGHVSLSEAGGARFGRYSRILTALGAVRWSPSHHPRAAGVGEREASRAMRWDGPCRDWRVHVALMSERSFYS